MLVGFIGLDLIVRDYEKYSLSKGVIWERSYMNIKIIILTLMMCILFPINTYAEGISVSSQSSVSILDSYDYSDSIYFVNSNHELWNYKENGTSELVDTNVSQISSYYSRVKRPSVLKDDGTLWAWKKISGTSGGWGSDDKFGYVKIDDNVIKVVSGNIYLKSDKTAWAFLTDSLNNDIWNYPQSTLIMDNVKDIDEDSIVITKPGKMYFVRPHISMYDGATSYKVDTELVMDNVVTGKNIDHTYYKIESNGDLLGYGFNSRGELGVGNNYSEVKNSVWTIGAESEYGSTSTTYYLYTDNPVKITNGVSKLYPTNKAIYAIKNDGSTWEWGRAESTPFDKETGVLNGNLGYPELAGEQLQGIDYLADGSSIRVIVKNDGSLWAKGTIGNTPIGGNSEEYNKIYDGTILK